MPPPPTRRRPAALESRAPSRCVSIVKERETHVPVGHACPVLVSEPGFEPGLRDSESRVLPVRRFRNCSRSGGSRTRAARSKSPACRLNTSDRVPLHGQLDSRSGGTGRSQTFSAPVKSRACVVTLRSRSPFARTFVFVCASWTHLTPRLTISRYTSPVERSRALRTPLVGPSGVEPASHCAARRLQRRSLPGDAPREARSRAPAAKPQAQVTPGP